MTQRRVHCEDAIAWLHLNEAHPGSSFVSSLPDISEFPDFTLGEWKNWFTETAKLILSRCPEEGVTFFYQSDIKFEGTWVDKAFLCLKAAEESGQQLLFHKIICRAPAGTITCGRPAYSHLLCFSKSLRFLDLSQSTADVVTDAGEKTWQRGMGLKTALLIAQFILDHTKTRKVIVPFCGEGSMLAAANHLGLEAVGIERSPKRAEKSRQLLIHKDGNKWAPSQERISEKT